MPRLIALDLGSHAVKATLFRVSGRQVDLEQRYSRLVPQDGTAPTLEHRLAALDALLHDSPTLKPSGSDVVVLAWPSSEAAFHRVAMPFSDKAQIERTLPFAIENEVPFELDEMVLSWRIVETLGQTQVMVALARRARVAELLAALAERNIDPAAVHVDADLYGPWGGGVVSLVDEGPVAASPPSDPLVALVDIGHLHTTVSVIRHGAVQVARSINVGGWSFTRAIATSMNVPWAEAEHIKHGAAHADVGSEDDPTESSDARHSGYASLPAEARTQLDASVGLLLAEIRSTLIKAEDTLGAEVVEVRLCGGGARIDEIWDYLAADLGVPVKKATDPRGDSAPGPFAVTQALAMASVAGSAPIDLRVGEFLFSGRTDLLRSALKYGVAGALVFSIAALAMFAFQYRGLSVEQNTTEAAVREIVLRSFPEVPESSIDTMGKAEAVMAQFTQDAVQRSEVLGSGKGSVPPTIDALYQLTKAFPPHAEVVVELSDLTITPPEGGQGGSITFNAETDGFGSSATVEEKLKANPRFKSATKGQEQKLANGRIRFPVTIPLGESEGEAPAAPGAPAREEEG
jgi:Tfp pilus assembly PilM family ATPase